MMLAKRMVNGEKGVCDDLGNLRLIHRQEQSHFLILKTLLSGVKSAKPGCPCLAVAILCALVGLAGGGAAVACGTPGQPSGASFRGAEWGIRGELSQEALHKACVGHSCWACHPGVCPQGQGPSELLTASDPSAEGKGNLGGAAGSGAAWALQVTLRVTWVTRFS